MTMMALLSLLLLIKLWPLLILWWRRRGQRKAALIALSEAADTTAIRAALRHFAAARGDRNNLSLTDWLQRHGGAECGDIIRQLAVASYSVQHDVDIDALRAQLLRALGSGRC